MPELTQLTRPKLVDAEVDFGGGEIVQIVFDRNAITPAWVGEAENRDSDRDRNGLALALASVVKRWDVYENGVELEPTGENIGRLSFPLQAFLLRAVLTAAVPARAEGNDSRERSNTQFSDSRAPAWTSQNGPERSSSPEHSTSPSPT